jgi:hypothetical protein
MIVKKIFSLVLALIMTAGLLPAAAASAAAGVTSFPGVTVLVEPSLEYWWVGEFSEGLAPVCFFEWDDDYNLESKVGYIDTSGELVFTIEGVGWLNVRGASRFSEGLAAVYAGYWCETEWRIIDRTGYIDTTGQFVIPMQDGWSAGWDSSFRGGMASVVIDSGFGSALIDKTGAYIIEPDKAENSRTYAFSLGGGMAVVNKGRYGQDGWIFQSGIININGEFIVDLSYDLRYRGLFGGLLLFETDDKVYTLYDKTGTAVRVLDFRHLEYEISEIYDDLMLVWDEDTEKTGIYDLDSGTILWLPFDMVEGYYNGLLLAANLNGDDCGCDCHHFHPECPCWWDDFDSCFCSYVVCAVCPDGGWGCIVEWDEYLIDRTGKIIFDHSEYDWFESKGMMAPGLVIAHKKSDEGATLYTNKGELIIPRGIYDQITLGSDGLVTVDKDGKWGILHIDISKVGGGTPYLDASGNTQICGTYTEYTGQTSLTSGWYVVRGAHNPPSRIMISGDVHLILADGSHLNAIHGVDVSNNNRLTIYAQSTE